MRYFNTSGPNIISQHYTLMRPQLVAEGLKKIEGDRYFTIWAPRQTGKSTYFRLLASRLEQEGYDVAYINFENFKTAPIAAFLNNFHTYLNNFWQVDFAGLGLADTFTEIIKITDRKWVLIRAC